jgi:2,4-dienoyl-CoA reductase (NADPH2)
LFEASGEIGGQFNLAKRIPGKEEFYETLRYFRKMLDINGVNVHLNTRVTAEMLHSQGFEQVVLATGIRPRKPHIEGIDHPRVVSYLEVLQGVRQVGSKVAIIGAGGIGFDVAAYITHESGEQASIAHYQKEWGIDPRYSQRGGVARPAVENPPRQVWLLQRSKGRVGEKLGKTTGWAHRLGLKARHVQMWNEVEYRRIDNEGLHLVYQGKEQCLPVDHVIICAGQEPLRELQAPLGAMGIPVQLIGGAKEAGELDAKRAIAEGWEVAKGL